MASFLGFFEVNEIVLWAGVWADSWQIVSVLGAGRSCLGSWGWYVAAVCQGVLGQERELLARCDA